MSDFLIGPTALENLYRVAGIIIQQPWRVGAWIHGGVCAKWAAGNRRARLALGNDGKIFLWTWIEDTLMANEREFESVEHACDGVVRFLSGE